MFSNESKRNAEACRFCWMCRHICTVSNVTGNEADTPRAKGLMVSMVSRGEPYDAEMAEIMYHCSLCDACANDCVTNYKPSQYIREARTLAVQEEMEPASVHKAIENLTEKGNLFGLTEKDPAVADAIARLPKQAEVVVYVGQTAAYHQAKSALALFSLLKKAGVSFTVLEQEPISGAYLGDLMGYIGDVQAVAEQVDAAVRGTGARQVVALNPHDAQIFLQQYQEWGLLEGIRVSTATAFVAGLIEEGKLTVTKHGGEASFHDPCRLARGLDESEPARTILAAMGVELKELFLNRRMSRCCGGLVLEAYNPGMAKLTARNREEDAVRLGYQQVVTACPDCLELLQKYGEGAVVYTDIFCMLDESC